MKIFKTIMTAGLLLAANSMVQTMMMLKEDGRPALPPKPRKESAAIPAGQITVPAESPAAVTRPRSDSLQQSLMGPGQVDLFKEIPKIIAEIEQAAQQKPGTPNEKIMIEINQGFTDPQGASANEKKLLDFILSAPVQQALKVAAPSDEQKKVLKMLLFVLRSTDSTPEGQKKMLDQFKAKMDEFVKNALAARLQTKEEERLLGVYVSNASDKDLMGAGEACVIDSNVRSATKDIKDTDSYKRALDQQQGYCMACAVLAQKSPNVQAEIEKCKKKLSLKIEDIKKLYTIGSYKTDVMPAQMPALSPDLEKGYIDWKDCHVDCEYKIDKENTIKRDKDEKVSCQAECDKVVGKNLTEFNKIYEQTKVCELHMHNCYKKAFGQAYGPQATKQKDGTYNVSSPSKTLPAEMKKQADAEFIKCVGQLESCKPLSQRMIDAMVRRFEAKTELEYQSVECENMARDNYNKCAANAGNQAVRDRCEKGRLEFIKDCKEQAGLCYVPDLKATPEQEKCLAKVREADRVKCEQCIAATASITDADTRRARQNICGSTLRAEVQKCEKAAGAK